MNEEENIILNLWISSVLLSKVEPDLHTGSSSGQNVPAPQHSYLPLIKGWLKKKYLNILNFFLLRKVGCCYKKINCWKPTSNFYQVGAEAEAGKKKAGALQYCMLYRYLDPTIFSHRITGSLHFKKTFKKTKFHLNKIFLVSLKLWSSWVKYNK